MRPAGRWVRVLGRARRRLSRRRLALAADLGGLPLLHRMLLLRMLLQELRRLRLVLPLELLARLLGELALMLGVLLLLQSLPLGVLLSGQTLLLLQMLSLENVLGHRGRSGPRRRRRIARMNRATGVRSFGPWGRRSRPARRGGLARRGGGAGGRWGGGRRRVPGRGCGHVRRGTPR